MTDEEGIVDMLAKDIDSSRGSYDMTRSCTVFLLESLHKVIPPLPTSRSARNMVSGHSNGDKLTLLVGLPAWRGISQLMSRRWGWIAELPWYTSLSEGCSNRPVYSYQNLIT